MTRHDDVSRNVRELRELADLAVAVMLGWLAAAAFGLALPLAIFVAVMACPVPETRGRLWRHPVVRLALVVLLLIWLVGNWSAYRHGVSAGYEAVAGATSNR